MADRATNIVIAGGGTGGHLYPALSVAEELKCRRPAASITFIGARRGLEQRLVPEAGFPLLSLSLSGLKGGGPLARVAASLAAGWAVVRCVAWMMRERPDLAIGVGGYASGPGVLAAKLLRIKTMVMEQNHYPGATNRWLAPRVDAVCLPSEEACGHIAGRRYVTGNPVRAEFFAIDIPSQREPLNVLVFGGSRGARSINRAVTAALDVLSRVQPRLRIVHQTGPADEHDVRAAYAGRPGGHEVAAFFDDMPLRLAAADLVICRAGASTLAELCAAGRPAVLVPYPFAADDHQTRNADTLVRAGAALLVPDAELVGTRWTNAVAALAADRERRLAMGRAARALARPDATARICDIAEALLDERLDALGAGHVS